MTTFDRFSMRRASTRGFVALILLLLLGACVPGAGQGTAKNAGGGTIWDIHVAVFPYGELFTTGTTLTSETGVEVLYTDVDFQLTYRVRARDVPSGASVFEHDYDTTTWLGTGGMYPSHRGNYATYNDEGTYEMHAQPLACLYRNGDPCLMGKIQDASQIFDVYEGFVDRS